MSTNVYVRDVDLAEHNVLDNRRMEVVADGLSLWNGSQLAIDTTLVSPLHRDGRARRKAAHKSCPSVRPQEEDQRQSTIKAREELAAYLAAQEKEEALLADGEQRLVQLVLKEKNNPSLFRSPPTSANCRQRQGRVVANADSDRFATRVGEIAGWSCGGSNSERRRFDGSCSRLRTNDGVCQDVGIDQRSIIKSPPGAVGVGASASKVGSTFAVQE